MQSPVQWARNAVERFRRLDVHTCNDAWKGVAFKPRYRFPILEGIARLSIFTVKEARSPREAPPRCRILVAVGTQNNYHSAEPVFGHRSDAAIFSFHNFKAPGLPHLNLLRTYSTGWAALLVLPLLISVEPRAHVRRSMRIRLDHLALSMGSRRNIRRFLRQSGAEVFVTLSNLTVYNNIMVEEAACLGMTTIFMTHAPVGRGQVALETDYALLDGEFQKRLYPPSRTRLVVTGSVRGERLSRAWRDRSGEQGVIVATNTLMRDMGSIRAFVEKLMADRPGLHVLVRPHPADRDRFGAHRELCAQVGATYSDPQKSLAEDSDGCKYLVTGVSGVAVDALLVGLYPLILRSPELDAATAMIPPDYYGLHELGLARTIDLHAPSLPDEWRIGPELGMLEAACLPGWSAKERIRDALEAIMDGTCPAGSPVDADHGDQDEHCLRSV